MHGLGFRGGVRRFKKRIPSKVAERAAVASWMALCIGCYHGVAVDADEQGPGPGAAESGGTDDEPEVDEEEEQGDPGRVTVHRLNNTEYANTVRDLLGTTLTPADDFPADDYSYGFDNISEVLSISPVQVELYHRAAKELAAEAMRGPVFVEDHRVQAEDVGGTTGKVVDGAWAFMLPGQLDATMALPHEGTYAIQVRAWADQAGAELAKMEVSVDGKAVQTFEVGGSIDAPEIYEVEQVFSAGAAGITVAFVNDYHVPEQNLDRNLYVDWVSLRGPAGATGETPIRDRIMVCTPEPTDPEPCVREIIEAFGRRAWRRPLTEEEVDDAVALFDMVLEAGDDAEQGLQVVIERFLASPKFLFRFEIDPDPTSLEPRPLDDHELASRLSYFLWSSMPDDELFAVADAGALSEPDELHRQIERMLADPKADALVENFAAQWLYLRGLDDHAVDDTLFPEFDDALREAMVQESKMFFREFLTSDRSVAQMLSAEFSFIDEALAAHYGIPVTDTGFQQVSLSATERRGLLGQGSILTVTSHPDRTSPVKRGQWVLEQLLCAAPPPPPPGVEGEPEGAVDGPIRDQLEKHRADPSCYGCHQAMDPIGLALEHFDAVGSWRDMDGPYEIDASGELPDGQTFEGAAELAQVIADDPRFTRCLTRKMLTYALGRGLTTEDKAALERIELEFLDAGGRLGDLVSLVATSYPFTHRRGEPE